MTFRYYPDSDMLHIELAAGASIGTAGGNQPVAVRDPYLGLRWIIALEGIYPSRN